MEPGPKTLQQAMEMFADKAKAREYAIAQRWPHGVRCPKCGSADVIFLERYERWHCRARHASPQFTLKTGTVMEDSPVPLGKWLIAMWMLANCRNGVSSYEIQRTIGVSQKTAWFMLHRIRLAMKLESAPGSMGSPSGGEVEVDETYVGPDRRKMSKRRKLAIEQERSNLPYRRHGIPFFGRTAVQGILDRDARKVRTKILPDIKRETLQAAILENVAKGSRVYTDEMVGYFDLAKREYVHGVVNHLVTYVDGRVHTNGLENFWSLLKRSLRGTYVAVEPFHLERYADEQAFRYNHRKVGERKMAEWERFNAVLGQVAGRRLTYDKLTGKEAETAF